MYTATRGKPNVRAVEADTCKHQRDLEEAQKARLQDAVAIRSMDGKLPVALKHRTTGEVRRFAANIAFEALTNGHWDLAVQQ